jgi:hypothetical protein
MSHLPFEAWIMEQKSLDNKRLLELKAHVDQCPQCSKLQSNWQAVETQLRTAHMAAPASGFSSRWQASLTERKTRQQRRQVYQFLAVLLGITLLSLVILITSILLNHSFYGWILATMHSISGTIHLWNQIEQVGYAIFRILPPAFSITAGILMACGLSMAIALWVVSLWRISNQGVYVK